MAKITKNFIAFFMVAFMSFSFASCGGNDEPETTDFLIGTWVYVYEEEFDEYFKVTYSFTFNADGTGRFLVIDEDHVYEDETFTYVHYPEESRIEMLIFDEFIPYRYKKVSETIIWLSLGDPDGEPDMAFVKQ